VEGFVRADFGWSRNVFRRESKVRPVLSGLHIRDMLARGQDQEDEYMEVLLGVQNEDLALACRRIGRRSPPARGRRPPQNCPQVKALLEVTKAEHSREELQELLELSDRHSFKNLYLAPAVEAGLIERTIPDKPTSHLQNTPYRKPQVNIRAKQQGPEFRSVIFIGLGQIDSSETQAA
jgi:hypothetical protein